MPAAYRIEDEPVAGPLGHLTVDPMWPFLAMMLGGAWIGLPWFAFNALALGSSTRRKEWLLAAICLPVALLLTFALVAIWGATGLPPKLAFYAYTAVVVWKLAVGYALYQLQGRSHGLFEYFGGTSRNGMLGIVGAVMLRDPVLALGGEGLLWLTVVS